MHFFGARTLFACGVLLVISSISHGSPANITTYDQRQTGEVNIHISVKDLKIIALLGGGLGGSEDYDYNYDYSELTVKPPHSNNITSTSTVATTTKKQIQEMYENVQITTEKIVEITPPSPILNLKPNNTALNPTHKPNSTILYTNHKHNGTENPNKNHTFTNVQTPGNVRPNDTGIPVQILTTPVEIVYNHKGAENSTISTFKPETSTATTSTTTIGVRQGDCIEGYRKDQRGICRPKIKRPVQQTLFEMGVFAINSIFRRRLLSMKVAWVFLSEYSIDYMASDKNNTHFLTKLWTGIVFCIKKTHPAITPNADATK